MKNVFICKYLYCPYTKSQEIYIKVPKVNEFISIAKYIMNKQKSILITNMWNPKLKIVFKITRKKN